MPASGSRARDADGEGRATAVTIRSGSAIALRLVLARRLRHPRHRGHGQATLRVRRRLEPAVQHTTHRLPIPFPSRAGACCSWPRRRDAIARACRRSSGWWTLGETRPTPRELPGGRHRRLAEPEFTGCHSRARRYAARRFRRVVCARPAHRDIAGRTRRARCLLSRRRRRRPRLQQRRLLRRARLMYLIDRDRGLHIIDGRSYGLDRWASRLRLGPERWVEERLGFAGRFRALGVWGPSRGPIYTGRRSFQAGRLELAPAGTAVPRRRTAPRTASQRQPALRHPSGTTSPDGRGVEEAGESDEAISRPRTLPGRWCEVEHASGYGGLAMVGVSSTS